MTEKQLVSKIKALTKKINNEGRIRYSYNELMEFYLQRSELLLQYEQTVSKDPKKPIAKLQKKIKQVETKLHKSPAKYSIRQWLELFCERSGYFVMENEIVRIIITSNKNDNKTRRKPKSE